jgi:hypothetical protein
MEQEVKEWIKRKMGQINVSNEDSTPLEETNEQIGEKNIPEGDPEPEFVSQATEIPLPLSNEETTPELVEEDPPISKPIEKTKEVFPSNLPPTQAYFSTMKRQDAPQPSMISKLKLPIAIIIVEVVIILLFYLYVMPMASLV